MRVALLTLALAVLGVGCGPAREEPAQGEAKLAKISPSDVTTTIVGASPEQETILREIVAGVGGVPFEQIEVREAEPEWVSADPGSVGLVVPYPRDGGDMFAEWHAWLIAHAFAVRSRELGLPRVTHLVPTGRDAEAEILGDPPARKGITSAEAMRRAEEAGQTAELFGADVKRIEILEPDGFGFLIELQVNADAAFFLREGLGPTLASFGDSPDPVDAGDFSVVRDARGRRIWEGAVASLGDSVMLTDDAEPSLRGCYWPHASAGPPGKPPLLCDGEEPLPKIVGAAPKQEAVLREILAGIGRTRVQTVEVARADENMPGPADAVQLKMQVPLDDRVADWHMELIANAFRARSHELRMAPVVYYSGGRGGQAFVGQPSYGAAALAGSLAQAREIAIRIRKAAAQHDAKVRRLQLIRPRRFAFILELQTGDPAEFLGRGFRNVMRPLYEAGIRSYDGWSIEVVDGEGKFVLGSGGWFSVRRDLESCAPVVTGFDTNPPPCPAR